MKKCKICNEIIDANMIPKLHLLAYHASPAYGTRITPEIENLRHEYRENTEYYFDEVNA